MSEIEELRLAYAECSRQKNELLTAHKLSAQESRAAVAKERERIQAKLMAMHKAANGRHNYYHCAAVDLFGGNDEQS